MFHHVVKAYKFRDLAISIGYEIKGFIRDNNTVYFKIYRDDIYIGKVRFSDHPTYHNDVDYCVFKSGPSNLLKWLSTTYKTKKENKNDDCKQEQC